MSNDTVVLAIFQNEESADVAAEDLKESGVAQGDAIGVLALNERGQLKAQASAASARVPASARSPPWSRRSGS